jgi:pimeloyl-ACP methyl ester carboxylesterase
LSIRTRRATLGVQVISKDDFRVVSPWPASRSVRAAGRPPAAAELRQRPGLRANRPGGMVDIPAGLDRITCPVLIMQGTADP